jgi:hypothetical protein
MRRRGNLTAGSDDVPLRRSELTSLAHDLAGSARDVAPSGRDAQSIVDDDRRQRERGAAGVRTEIAECVVSTSLIATDREMDAPSAVK